MYVTVVVCVTVSDADGDGVTDTDTVTVADVDDVSDVLSDTVALNDTAGVIDMLEVTVMPEVDDHEPVRDSVLVTVTDTVGDCVGDAVNVDDAEKVVDAVTDSVFDAEPDTVADGVVLGLALGLARQFNDEPAGTSTDKPFMITAWPVTVLTPNAYDHNPAALPVAAFNVITTLLSVARKIKPLLPSVGGSTSDVTPVVVYVQSNMPVAANSLYSMPSVEATYTLTPSADSDGDA